MENVGEYPLATDLRFTLVLITRMQVNKNLVLSSKHEDLHRLPELTCEASTGSRPNEMAVSLGDRHLRVASCISTH
jgi:hypothetical protein